MSDFLDWLRGKKTYLCAAAMVILSGLHAQGYMNDSWFNNLQVLVLGGGLAALRAGVTKGGTK